MAGALPFHEIFGHTQVTKAISRVKTPMQRFQNFFGMQPGGAAVNSVGGRNFGWDIMDASRNIARGRPPGTGPSSVSLHPVAHQNAAAYRAHEKKLLLEERIFRTRPLGGNFGSIDIRGQNYVARQEMELGQRFSNSREFMINAMCKGGFDLVISGDDWRPMPLGTGGTAAFPITTNVPADHTTTIASIFGAWGTTTTDVLGQILDYNKYSEAAHGMPVRHIWLNSTTWKLVLANTGFQTVAGSANVVFQEWQPTGLRSSDGIQDTGFNAVLRALPFITWHIYDAGLNMAGDRFGVEPDPDASPFTLFLPDNTIILTPDPSPMIAEWYEGSEIVAENVMSAGEERYGITAWVTRVIDPAGFELKALDNGLPVLYIPRAISYVTVEP